MIIRSILALTDFSTPAENGLEQAALIAVRHQARLRIMHGAEEPHPKFSDPFARLQQRARQLARRHGITVEAVACSGDFLENIVQQTARADLLELEHRRHRAFRTFWRGTTLDQLMRRCQCPLLIVKQAPSRRYARMLIAVDFTTKSTQLVRYACSFETESELELFHSVKTFDKASQCSAGSSAEAVKACKHAASQGAQGRLLRVSSSFDSRRNRVASVTGCGEPARQIAVQQDAMDSDLVVVGKTSRSMVVDFLFGSVARRLIDLVNSDVLVVSHDYQARLDRSAKGSGQTARNDARRGLQVVRKRAI